MNITFLVSGGGGNMKFIYLASKLKLIKKINITLIGDRSCKATDFGISENIPTHIINYNRNCNKELLSLLEASSPDFIITNWHKIIDSETVEKYDCKMINLHYSLLPSFPGIIGTKPIAAAYNNGCKFFGVTSHFVDTGVDTGKIIGQAIIKTDLPFEEAVNAAFQKGCLILLNSLDLISEGKIVNSAPQNTLDFSPDLRFNHQIFTKGFWEMVANA